MEPDNGAAFLEANRTGEFVQLQSSRVSSSSSSPSLGAPVPPPKVAKSQGDFNCPFEGCPYAKQHLSKAVLVSHLSARHVASGQIVPTSVLKLLKHTACLVCKTLHKEGSPCQCRGPQLQRDNALDPHAAECPNGIPPPQAGPPISSSPSTPLTTACPSTLLPTFSDILAARISTVRHIPGACRRGVAASLSSLISAFVHCQSWEALHRLQCFPKLVLRAPKRAGKKHAKQLALDIARRLRLFEANQMATLWVEATTVVHQAKPTRTRAQVREQQEALPKSVVQTIRGLVEEGALSKAAKHLLSTGLADASDPAVVKRLQGLHPNAPPIATGGDTALPDHIDPRISTEEDECEWGKLAWNAVTSFSPGSAPGPSGLRPGHLKECLGTAGRGSSLQCALGELAQTGIEHGFAPAARDVLCAATLIPLRKKDDGVRPIAVGETLRRVVGKCLLNTDCLKAQLLSLQPRQCGVGVRGATELVGMGLQRFVEARKDADDWVVLTLDMSNAFNTIHREAILRSCAKRMPAAYNWLRFCYQGHSPLFCQGQLLLSSQSGTHQGDTCGPLGFVLGLEEALEAAGGSQLDWECWYLDDGTIVGTSKDVFDYLGRLQVALSNVGLHLNLGKCQLWGPGVQSAGDTMPRYPEGLALDHPGRAIPVMSFVENSGITLLGVPIDFPGSSHCTHRHWAATVDATLALLGRLRLFPGCQIQHALLRYCLDACRVMHLQRSTVNSKAGDAPQKLSDALRTAVEDLVGCGFSDTAWQQATLPLRHGGLGIRDPIQTQPAARMAALVGLELNGRERVGVPEVALSRPSQDLVATIDALRAQLGPNFEPLAGWYANPTQLASASFDHASQRWWAEQVAQEQRSRLCQLGTARDMARLQSQEGPISSGWMSVLPCRAVRTDIGDVDYRVLLRWWLGLPLLPLGRLSATHFVQERTGGRAAAAPWGERRRGEAPAGLAAEVAFRCHLGRLGASTMLGRVLDYDGVSRKTQGVGDREVHGDVTAPLPRKEEDVGWPASVAACDLLGSWDGGLHQCIKERIAQSVVASGAPILVTAHKVVPEGVHRFAACRTAGERLPKW